MTATARSTVVSPSLQQPVLDGEGTYHRLDNHVLVDPEASGVASDLLVRLPVPEAALTSHLESVLPPETAREFTHQRIDSVVGYDEDE